MEKRELEMVELENSHIQNDVLKNTIFVSKLVSTRTSFKKLGYQTPYV